jgi:hypothetical protein
LVGAPEGAAGDDALEDLGDEHQQAEGGRVRRGVHESVLERVHEGRAEQPKEQEIAHRHPVEPGGARPTTSETITTITTITITITAIAITIIIIDDDA